MPSPAHCKTLMFNNSSNAPHDNPKNPDRYLIYFITGNPGLIDYYTTFLYHLTHLLSASQPKHAIRIVGRSLPGFLTENAGYEDEDKYSYLGNPPFGLEEVIQRVEDAIVSVASDSEVFGFRRDGRGDGNGDGNARGVKVVLVGHSVGTYIMLEVIRRLNERRKQEKLGFDVVGGVALFATVMNLAGSQSGRKFTGLCRIPAFPLIVSLITKFLTLIIPFTILRHIVMTVTGFQPDASALTAEFLRSKHGVRQALHMARDELETITLDKWDEDIWGAATPSSSGSPRPKLFFYFGKEDHWVANETRDELIAARGYKGDDDKWKPKMEIEESDIPHSFSIRHSIPVAEKVAEYIEEIIEADAGQG